MANQARRIVIIYTKYCICFISLSTFSCLDSSISLASTLSYNELKPRKDTPKNTTTIPKLKTTVIPSITIII